LRVRTGTSTANAAATIKYVFPHGDAPAQLVWGGDVRE
jgi:hypothetical protein